MSSELEPGHLTDEDLQSYLDAELAEKKMGWASAHLRTCPTCQERAAAMQEVFRALSGLPEINLGRDLASAVLDRIRPLAAPSRRWPWLVAAQALAAAFLAVWLGRSAALDWITFATASLQSPPSWLVDIVAWSRTAGQGLWMEAQAWVSLGADVWAQVPEFSWTQRLSPSPSVFGALLVLWLAGNGLLLIPGVGRAGQTS